MKSDCTTVAWLPISLSDKSFSQQVSGKTMYFINSNLIKKMCEDVVIAEVKLSSLHRLYRGDLCSHLQNCSCTIPLAKVLRVLCKGSAFYLFGKNKCKISRL